MLFQIMSQKPISETSEKTIEGLKKKLGFVPNLVKGLAPSTAALKSYADILENLSHSSLTELEKQVLFLAISIENKCKYCSAAHSWGAKAEGLDSASIKSIHDWNNLTFEKLNALLNFGRKMVIERGNVSKKDIQSFLDAGYTEENILDVITQVAATTISNYANNILETPIDERFQKPIT